MLFGSASPSIFFKKLHSTRFSVSSRGQSRCFTSRIQRGWVLQALSLNALNGPVLIGTRQRLHVQVPLPRPLNGGRAMRLRKGRRRVGRSGGGWWNDRRHEPRAHLPHPRPPLRRWGRRRGRIRRRNRFLRRGCGVVWNFGLLLLLHRFIHIHGGRLINVNLKICWIPPKAPLPFPVLLLKCSDPYVGLCPCWQATVLRFYQICTCYLPI